jgi:hypothetical protein
MIRRAKEIIAANIANVLAGVARVPGDLSSIHRRFIAKSLQIHRPMLFSLGDRRTKRSANLEANGERGERRFHTKADSPPALVLCVRFDLI